MRQYFYEMLHGPGSLRVFIQPAIALLLGVRDGINDWALGRGPYLITIFRQRKRGTVLLRQGLRAIALPLCIAVAASLLFQYLIRARMRFVPALLYAILFVAIPYMLARAVANRVERFRHRPRRPTGYITSSKSPGFHDPSDAPASGP
jgi:hypothetical protein